MKLNTKMKRNTREYGCADTSVSAIGNGFVGFSGIESKVTLFGFDNNLSNKSIPIGSAATNIEFTNGTIIDQLNINSILSGDGNYLLYTSQACEFGVSIRDFSQ